MSGIDIGSRVRVTQYVRGQEAEGEVVYAVPGETGVVLDVSSRTALVVFDRTGYQAGVLIGDIAPASDAVNIRPL